jgi:hypothetical protein
MKHSARTDADVSMRIEYVDWRQPTKIGKIGRMTAFADSKER